MEDRGLSAVVEDDVDMEEDEDEDEEDKFVSKYFKKRFLVKRKRMNGNDGETPAKSIEESLANLSTKEIYFKVKSDNFSEKLYGTKQIRKLVSSSENNSSIFNEILSHEILKALADCLSLPNEELQFETAWILTNISAGSLEQTKALFDLFIHLTLLKLFKTECNANIANQTLCAIGNIMAENDGFCYDCIYAGITEPLIKQMKKFLDNVPFMRTVSWVIGQMSHLKDTIFFKETAWDLFPALGELARNEDSEVCINAVWGLGYLTEGDIDLLMNFNKNVIKTVAPYLISSNLELQIATLHFFANCASGNDEITQKIVNCGVIKNLNEFLNHKNVEVVRETVWMLSNILAGTEKQIKAVFDAGLMPKIIELLESSDKNVAEKALWAVTNVPLCGTPEQINLLLNLNVIPSLCYLLKSDKNQILEAVVEAINKIQQNCSNRKGKIRQSIITSGNSVERLRELQNHYSETLQRNATQILTDLFNE
uniref:Importin subunit alpha n=1 Tax=Panagrolaimus sp. PS1159 TaxID=55785 RepID=A0AC35FVN6_9BILA